MARRAAGAEHRAAAAARAAARSQADGRADRAARRAGAGALAARGGPLLHHHGGGAGGRHRARPARLARAVPHLRGPGRLEADRWSPHEVLTWLRAARGEDAPRTSSPSCTGWTWRCWSCLLREFTVMHDLEENPDVNPEGVTMETPEGRYLVEFKAEGAELAGVRALLNDLIAENPFEAVRLLRGRALGGAGRDGGGGLPVPPGAAAGPGLPPAGGGGGALQPGGHGARAGAGARAPRWRPRAGSVDYLDAAFRGLDGGGARQPRGRAALPGQRRAGGGGGGPGRPGRHPQRGRDGARLPLAGARAPDGRGPRARRGRGARHADSSASSRWASP